MGVTGLWKLIEPCGKPVPVETLEGKILAVDISIWLHQAVKGFQDNKGAALNNAHLLGLFHRLCKLMYYRVKPVFVFDGCVPQLKRDTIARRQQQRSKLNIEADRIQALLLQSLAKEKMVQQALGPNAEHLLTSPIKKLAASKANRKDDAMDDMFKLPELPESLKNNPNQLDDETTDDSFNESSFYSTDGATSASTDDSSFDESNPRNSYSSNLQAIDVRSKDFLKLPADVRHEILVDIKETRKQSSWGRLHELPSHSDDFSTFQMKRLLKRRDVQVSLETAEQEMGGRSLTFAELTNIFTEEGILETDLMKQGTKQISSDEHTRFLLVRDLKKKITQLKDEKEVIEEDELKPPPTKLVKSDDMPSTSKVSSSIAGVDKYGNEFDADLELAMALSLEEEDKVYDEKDYDYNSDESIKLTKDQRYQLQNAAKGPARSYMIEYAGMNKEEVIGIMEKTQKNLDFDDTLDIEHLIGGKDNKLEEIKKPSEKNDLKPENKVNESQEIRLCVTDDSDATDSDLEEVQDNTENAKSALNIIVDIKNIAPPEDDLFADVFKGQKDIIENNIETEDECVIEETPPCFDDDEWEDNRSKVLNIKVDLSKPLKPEEDLFADIFENKDININEDEDGFVPETPTSIIDQEIKETKQLPANETNNSESKIPPRSEKIRSILDELKQQADEIKNIRLENIKLNNSIIEISDDELSVKPSVKPEVIEICDSDDNKRPSTPPPSSSCAATEQSPRLKTKSPKLKTPSKNHSITEFFDVNYVVKRTPDKPIQEENEVPKIKSPFFVRKTPKSARKSNSNSPSPTKKMSKANKTLFTQENENVSKDGDDIEKGMQPIIEPTTTSKPNEQDVLNQAAELLKSNKTTEELNDIASVLANERRDLENERNRQDRMGMSITQRMNSDCQDLLRLFGVPFIVAPMEAEAQCAFLDIVQLTNGTITDDSDIWLFGGRTVYKNFFAQNKHVLEFRSEQIEKDFQCDRKKLIQLACLVGSDYTTGIHGIGAVTALEILASFAPKDYINEPNDPIPTSIQHILATLQRFRNWWESFKSTAAPPGSSARLALQKKLKNIEMQEGFPSLAVVEAYLTPKVDDNKDTFSWGYPDVESLREFTRKTFGWTTSKTDDILMPVIKKLNDKRTQQSIRNYFNVKNTISSQQIKVSKRVKNAIDKMSGKADSDNTPEKPTKAKRTKKAVNAKKNKPVNDASPNKPEEFDVSVTIEPSCSNRMAKGPLNRTSKRVNIPNKTDIIPQREKDLAKLEENKRQAAEILKNSAKVTKKKRKA